MRPKPTQSILTRRPRPDQKRPIARLREEHFAGGLGQAGMMLRGSLPLQQGLLFTAALSLCLLALYLAGVTPLVRTLEAAGAMLWRRVQPLARGLLPVDDARKALGLGILWGWLPCGMVYAVLLLALGSGDAIQGGMVMLAFGLGTLPNMLMIGGLARRARHPLKRQALRLTAAAVIAGVGLYGMIHALHPQAHTAGGLICLVAR